MGLVGVGLLPRLGMKDRAGVLDETVPGDGRALLVEAGEMRETEWRVVSETGVTAKRGTPSSG